MIVVQLLGGLGNQMFQYALGRHLAMANNTSLRLDLTRLGTSTPQKNYTFRNYGLDKFNIHAQIADNSDIAYFFSDNSVFNTAYNQVRKWLGILSIKNEKDFEFHSEILTTGKNVYLTGYWQSEKYFSQIAGIIKNDFTIKENLKNEVFQYSKLKRIIDKISETNSVAIHFRRGDYVSDKLTNEYHGVCTIDYYQEAIEYIKTMTHLPHFFLFSDEPDWLKSKFALNEPCMVIDDNPGFVDLYLMSLCKHDIIANSSFSWWGAWLNNNTEKIVVAPQKWFADTERNQHTSDLIPDKWIRI